jgi:TusA-related sulfurtransferase
MQRLDIRGMIQPFTFLIISNAFKEIPVGETIELLWGDPDSLSDLLKILPADSYALLSTEAIKGVDSGIRIHLKKITQQQGGRDASPVANPKTPNQKGEKNDRPGLKRNSSIKHSGCPGQRLPGATSGSKKRHR